MSAEQIPGRIESDPGLQLIPSTQPAPENGSGLEPLRAQVREYVRASKAENTLRGYQTDWRDFCAWCESRGGLCPLPAAVDMVAADPEFRLILRSGSDATISNQAPTRRF